MKSGLQAFSFNGEPQAQAKPGNDACGLPLNDQNDSHRAGLCQPPDFRQTQHQGTHVPRSPKQPRKPTILWNSPED